MASLTEQEQQEVMRFIEAGRPLPDKYRFLLFEEKREVELVWNGKTGEVCNIVLPFQIIEQVDEPRAEKDVKLWPSFFDAVSGRQLKGWTNKLIWGDNKLILSSLKNGPLREEIEKQGGLNSHPSQPPFAKGGSEAWGFEEVWTGDYVFENEWQSFRTKKDRAIELTSVFHECPPGRRKKIAVKVVDIFGNDTMTIVDVRV